MTRKHKAAAFGSAVILFLGYGFYMASQSPYRFTHPNKPFVVRGRPLASGGGSVWAFTYKGNLEEEMEKAAAEIGLQRPQRGAFPVLRDGNTSIHFAQGRAELNPNPRPRDPKTRGPYDFIVHARDRSM